MDYNERYQFVPSRVSIRESDSGTGKKQRGGIPMASRQGRSTSRRTGVKTRGQRQLETAQASQDRNNTRRELYDSDVDYAEEQRRAARAHYYSRRDKVDSDLAAEGRLLKEGIDKEVVVHLDDGDIIQVHEVYSIPEAADALGKALLTLKRWIQQGIIPEPVVTDTVKGHKHYTKGELQSIARILIEHENEYTYLKQTHTDTVDRLHEVVSAYREAHM